MTKKDKKPKVKKEKKSMITIIIGLPGSGKSSYIENNKEFDNALICDDYHESSPEFSGSKYYPELIKAIKDGRGVVISDIIYCMKDKLEFVSSNLKELGISEIGLIYFENNPQACKKNILKRGRKGRIDREVEFVNEFNLVYKIPPGAKVMPIRNL